MKISFILYFSFIVIIFSGCSQDRDEQPVTGSNGEALEKVSIVLNWFPEAEHGGFYATDILGYYEEEGLDVEIISGGVDVQVAPRVATRQVEFGVMNADRVVFARAAEANVVALNAPLQNSPRCIMVHEESGKRQLSDLTDMTLAMNMQGAFAQFIKANSSLENVKIVPYPGSISVFLNDQNFGQQAYVFSEPFVAKKNGANPYNIMLSDAGFNVYTSCLITSDELLEERPELVEKFTRASIKGWQTYMKDYEETNKVINSLNPEMGMDILAFGVEQMQPLVFTESVTEKNLGAMTADRWQTLVQQMEELELIEKGEVSAASCYTTDFQLSGE